MTSEAPDITPWPLRVWQERTKGSLVQGLAGDPIGAHRKHHALSGAERQSCTLAQASVVGPGRNSGSVIM